MKFSHDSSIFSLNIFDFQFFSNQLLIIFPSYQHIIKVRIQPNLVRFLKFYFRPTRICKRQYFKFDVMMVYSFILWKSIDTEFAK